MRRRFRLSWEAAAASIRRRGQGVADRDAAGSRALPQCAVPRAAKSSRAGASSRGVDASGF